MVTTVHRVAFAGHLLVNWYMARNTAEQVAEATLCTVVTMVTCRLILWIRRPMLWRVLQGWKLWLKKANSSTLLPSCQACCADLYRRSRLNTDGAKSMSSPFLATASSPGVHATT